MYTDSFTFCCINIILSTQALDKQWKKHGELYKSSDVPSKDKMVS